MKVPSNPSYSMILCFSTQVEACVSRGLAGLLAGDGFIFLASKLSWLLSAALGCRVALCWAPCLPACWCLVTPSLASVAYPSHLTANPGSDGPDGASSVPQLPWPCLERRQQQHNRSLPHPWLGQPQGYSCVRVLSMAGAQHLLMTSPFHTLLYSFSTSQVTAVEPY